MNATGASANSDSLPASLAVQAHNLYKQDLLSDIKLIIADNQRFPGRKFLLTARSKEWKASQVGFQNVKPNAFFMLKETKRIFYVHLIKIQF